MRNKFADAIYEIGKKDKRICALVADISPAGSMMSNEKSPESTKFRVSLRPYPSAWKSKKARKSP